MAVEAAPVEQVRERAYKRYAWLIPFILAILIVLAGVYELTAGIDAADFQTATG